MFVLYNIFINIFCIFSKIYLKIRIKNKKEHPERYLEKLSITNFSANKDRLICSEMAIKSSARVTWYI